MGNKMYNFFHNIAVHIHRFVDDPHVKNLMDIFAVSSAVVTFFEWMTLSHFTLLCSGLWSFGRLVEMVTGKPVHRLIANAWTWVKAKFGKTNSEVQDEK